MPTIERVCKITGKKFFVSELEQELRKKFNVALPDIHPHERMRRLFVNRNMYSLTFDVCDLCGKKMLSMWGENPVFPVYCSPCWNSDNWKPAERDLDLEKPFFDQLKKLVDVSPHPAASVIEPIVNSEFCNSATNVKNCYMSFNIFDSEECHYCVSINKLKECIDVSMTDQGECLYASTSCDNSYQVFWSEFAQSCSDSYFLYDCVSCSNCALSSGLRHKQYVFMNEQLTKEEYEKKITELKTGSYMKLQEYLKKFQEMKKTYPKKYLIGQQNDHVTGNVIFQSKNLEDAYYVSEAEDSVNVFNATIDVKDALDMVAFGHGAEKIFSCTSVGADSSDLMFCVLCYKGCTNLRYCLNLRTSQNSFGSCYARGLEFTILNKKYSPEEYQKTVEALKLKMEERGEWGIMLSNELLTHPYNESLANIMMPLSKEEALKLGYRWAEVKIPHVDPALVFQYKDTIGEVSWDDLKDKVLMCEESGRPFRVIKQEFDFYKKYSLPLPRLHPEVRMFHRYPKELYFNLHDSKCRKCGAAFQTSMPDDDIVYCEKCYLENIS
jgi:hypothetical protein